MAFSFWNQNKINFVASQRNVADFSKNEKSFKSSITSDNRSSLSPASISVLPNKLTKTTHIHTHTHTHTHTLEKATSEAITNGGGTYKITTRRTTSFGGFWHLKYIERNIRMYVWYMYNIRMQIQI